MLSLRRSASVPVTVVPLARAAFFFVTAFDTGNKSCYSSSKVLSAVPSQYAKQQLRQLLHLEADSLLRKVLCSVHIGLKGRLAATRFYVSKKSSEVPESASRSISLSKRCSKIRSRGLKNSQQSQHLKLRALEQKSFFLSSAVAPILPFPERIPVHHLKMLSSVYTCHLQPRKVFIRSSQNILFIIFKKFRTIQVVLLWERKSDNNLIRA
nr:hypothetical protein Iba_chr14fCG1430 [Ipomoea batatas]